MIKIILLAILLASPLAAQVHIPIRKEKPRVDTVRLRDTVRVVRVDTVRVVDTVRLVRVDTLRDSTCQGFFPFPIPIPIGRDARELPQPIGTTITPEPSMLALALTGIGTVAVYLYFTRR